MFNIPAGLTVLQIIPSSVTVRFDDVIAKAVPVQVPRTGSSSIGGSSSRAGTSLSVKTRAARA